MAREGEDLMGRPKQRDSKNITGEGRGAQKYSFEEWLESMEIVAGVVKKDQLNDRSKKSAN